MEPYIIIGPDLSNLDHVVITVRGRNFSVISGMEQSTADEIGENLDAAG